MSASRLRIYKYKLEGPNAAPELPRAAKVLSAAAIGQSIYVWVSVDTSMPPVERRFAVYGTGHHIEHDMADLRFINTVLMDEGALVWHVFEVLP